MIYQKLPILLLTTIATEKAGSTNSEIASLLLKNLSAVKGFGIRDMAAFCHVGTGSISRFCKEIGLADYAELRELMLTTEFSADSNETREPLSVSLGSWRQSVKHSIDQASGSVHRSDLEELCRDLSRYERIAAFGLLKAESAALSFQTDMLMLGKSVYTNLSFPEQIQYLEQANAEDLVLIFSYTGTYFDSLQKNLRFSGSALPKIWMISGGSVEKPSIVSRQLRFESDGSLSGHPYQLLTISDLIVRYFEETRGER